MAKTEGFLNKLTQFALDKTRNRVLLILIFSLLPFGNWVASVIVCLTTLRKGFNDGMVVLLWAILPDLLVLSLGIPAPVVLFDLNANYLVPFFLALTLRSHESWRSVLLVLTCFGFVELATYEAFFPGYAHSTIAIFQKVIREFWGNPNLYTEAQLSFIDSLVQIVPYVVGIKIVLVSVISLTNLLMARGLQSYLFNPGGLKKELLTIRLSNTWLLFYALCCGYWMMNPGHPLSIACLMVGSLPFVVSGLSIMHGSLTTLSKNRRLLTVLVYLAIFLLMYYSLIPLILMSIYDVVKQTRLKYRKII